MKTTVRHMAALETHVSWSSSWRYTMSWRDVWIGCRSETWEHDEQESRSWLSAYYDSLSFTWDD
jgi:hypothetical protein